MHSVPPSEFYKCGAIIGQGPSSFRIAWGKRAWSALPPPQAPSAWYSPDFFLQEPNPWFTHEMEKEITLCELRTLIEPSYPIAKYVWSQPYEQTFRQACLDLQERIRGKSLRKGVPYVVESTEGLMTPELLNRTLHFLLDYAQRLPVTIYGFWEEGRGMIGATPEILFTLNPDQPNLIETDALAGTTHLRCPKQLMSDPKERDEHQIVIEGIQTSLSQFGSVRIGDTKIVSLATLGHLKTPIQVESNARPTFQEIVTALHPTPALGAYPKEQGWPWLQQYQRQVARERYGAPFGYIRPQEGSAQCLVAIRNVQWDAEGMRIGAGCGVVAHSDVDQEWSEVQAKIAAIKELLGL
jgi:menaquinone-specific isochorismate synthase